MMQRVLFIQFSRELQAIFKVHWLNYNSFILRLLYAYPTFILRSSYVHPTFILRCISYTDSPKVAITFSSIAIGVGKLFTSTVVRQACTSLKYSPYNLL